MADFLGILVVGLGEARMSRPDLGNVMSYLYEGDSGLAVSEVTASEVEVEFWPRSGNFIWPAMTLATAIEVAAAGTGIGVTGGGLGGGVG